jgi:hypothetical protein
MMRRLVIWLLLGTVGFALGRAMAGAPESGRSAPRREAPEPQPAPRGAPAAEPETSWVERIEKKPWAIQVAQVGREMRAQATVARIEATYRGMREPLRRWHFVRGLTQNGPCPFLHDVIRWMQEDPDPELRRRALRRIRHLSFREFEEDPEGCRQWQAKYAARPPRDAYLDGMRSFAARLRTDDENALVAVYREYPTRELEFNWNAARVCGLHLRDAALQTGLTEAVAGIAGNERLGVGARAGAFAMLAAIDPGQEFLEPVVRAALDEPRLHKTILVALSESTGGWVAPLLDEAVDLIPDRSDRQDVLLHLARCDDERAFPILIARSVDPRLGALRWIALDHLTESEGPFTDTNWWLDWWDRNGHRFGASARGIDVRARMELEKSK